MARAAILLPTFVLARPADAYFGRQPEGSAEPAPPPPEPGSFEQLITAVAAWQRDFHLDLTQAMQAAGDGGRLWPVLAVAVSAFLYGVFHAVGPGHGKAVVSGYFIARRATPWRAVALGGAIAGVQALAAILLVGGLAGLAGLGGMRLLGEVSLLEMASYALILVLGMFMMYRAVRREPCCRDPAHPHGAGGQGHAGPGVPETGPPGAGIWPAALAVGIRPCSGALIVLLFASANQAYLLGAGAVLAMGFGVAITISAIGIGAIGVRRGLGGLAGRRPRFAAWSQTAFAVAGAAIVVLAGGLMLLGASSRAGILA